MRISISVTNYSWPSGPGAFGTDLTQVVKAADQSGVDTVWVADHLLQADPTAGPDQTEMYEAHTVLGFLAAGYIRYGVEPNPLFRMPGDEKRVAAAGAAVAAYLSCVVLYVGARALL